MVASAKTEAFVIFQYSNGIGHLTRCSVLAEALTSIAGLTMFSGGAPLEGYPIPSSVDFVQLPAIRWDFVTGASPTPVESGQTLAEIERERSEILVEHYRRKKPRIVIVEYFPFAPHRFGRTLNGLFEAINSERRRPIVICSIRTYPRLWDVDVDPAWINAQLRDDFSCVLHHADPKFFPLSSLGPYLQSALSGIKVWQTGFVRRPFSPASALPASNGLLLTLGGGGALGAVALTRWINAARAGSPDLFPINAVCGPLMSAEDRKRVHAEEGTGITVHDQVANMDELMNSSRAVVCMGGYNTLTEALSLGKPVLAFPHGDVGDQPFQIKALHSQGLLLKGELRQSESVTTAMMNELLRFRPAYTIDCNGAERSVEIIKQLLEKDAA